MYTHNDNNTFSHTGTCRSQAYPPITGYKYTSKLKQMSNRLGLQIKAQSPLHLAAWSAVLRYHPDTEFAGYILEGIQHDFRVGYNYTSHTCAPASSNLHVPSAKDHLKIITKYIATEVAKGRMLGPFPTHSIPEVQVSRIGVIPKKSKPGKWRLIVDLSFQHGSCVNDGIDVDMASLSYIKVEEVATRATQTGQDHCLRNLTLRKHTE